MSTEALLRQEGLEPLTDRELQILQLLDKDLHEQGDCARAGAHDGNGQGAYQQCLSQAQREQSARCGYSCQVARLYSC